MSRPHSWLLGHGRKASTSPYPSILVQSLSLYQELFHAYTPLPYPYFLQLAFLDHQFYSHTLSLQTLYSFNPYHQIAKQFFSPIPLHNTSHATFFIHAFIALTLPSCYTTCSSQITNFHTTHSWLPTQSLICMSMLAGEYCSSLHLHGHIPSSHKSCKWSYDTPAFHSLLSYFSFHLSMLA